jgi:rieske iron-sulfur protein
VSLSNRPTAPGCGRKGDQPASDLRRKVVKIAVAGMAVRWSLTSELAQAAITRGDCLVDEDAEGTPVPLKAVDLRVGKPMVAYPFDIKNAVVRNESRLNKIILLKLPEGDLDAATKARSAGGVIAYSAICTHQACDAKTWLSKEKALVCFCHSSKFLVLENGAVANGPATRSLPSIALALEGDQLVIAGAFSAPPGTGA